MLGDRKVSAIHEYYEDGRGFAGAFKPFLIAPHQGFQDTIIAGPQSLGQSHDAFISELYGTAIRDLRAPAFRAFLYQSHVCFAVTMPTDLLDEAGRKGLYLTIGFMCTKGSTSCGPAVLAKYLLLIVETINRRFLIDLPGQGADKLLQSIQEQNDMRHKITDAMDAMLLASVILAKAKKINRLVPLRFRPKLLRRTPPNILLYPPTADAAGIVSMFFDTLWPMLSRLNHFGVQQEVESGEERTGILSLLPLPDILADARDVKCRAQSGKPYIFVYW